MTTRGQVEILFPSTTKPKTHHECCCNDCRLRVTYLQDRGGPTAPSKANMTVYTLDNKMVIAKGKDKLYLYKLTPDTMLLNMSCTCCHRFLMARHAQYHGPSTVATSPDSAIFHNIQVDSNDKLMAHWFTNLHEDPSKLEGLDSAVPRLWVTSEGQIAGSVNHWANVFQAQMEAILTPVPEDGRCGETFEDIVEFIGNDTILVVNNEQVETSS